MIETGRIQSITDRGIFIQQDQTTGCFGCMNLECKSGGRLISASNPLNLPLAAGQRVETEAKNASLLAQALNFLILPLAAFAAAFFLTGLIAPGSEDPLRTAMGAAALFAAAFILYAYRRRFPAKVLTRVTRVIE